MLERAPKIMLYVALAMLAALIVAPLSHRFGLVAFGPVFQALLGIALVCVLLALAAVVVTIMLRVKKLPGVGLSRTALVVALIPVGILGVQYVNASRVPVIHDISTDWQDPPVFEAALQQRGEQHNSLDPNPESIAAQHAHYGNLGGPRVFNRLPPQLMGIAKEVAQDMGWDVLVSESGRLEAVDKSFWFGFRDDVVVRVRAVGADASVLDIRSASRIGRSDLGKNAQRIEDFLQRVTQRVGN